MIGFRKAPAASIVAAVLASAPEQSQAQNTLILGSTGSASANGFPICVAIDKGFLPAEEGVQPALVRVEMHAAPYSLPVKPGIRTIELESKIVLARSADDMTRIFVERLFVAGVTQVAD